MKKSGKMKKMKNEINEKMRKEKMDENDEKRKKNEKHWIQKKNPLQFPRFTVVVVSLFVKILDDFHDFVSVCLFPLENQQPVLGGQRFF